MPGLSDVTGRLQYKARLDSVTKEMLDDFRNKGAVDMVIGLGERFGRNNRALLGGILHR